MLQEGGRLWVMFLQDSQPRLTLGAPVVGSSDIETVLPRDATASVSSPSKNIRLKSFSVLVGFSNILDFAGGRIP